MSTIRKHANVSIPPEQAWDAARDFGALHERLVPGFVTGTRLDGDDRIVTFFNGATARERLISIDDDSRRLAWTIVEGRYEHHNGSLEVVPDGDGCEIVWTTDLLPDALAEFTEAMMERGCQVMQLTLEAAAPARP